MRDTHIQPGSRNNRGARFGRVGLAVWFGLPTLMLLGAVGCGSATPGFEPEASDASVDPSREFQVIHSFQRDEFEVLGSVSSLVRDESGTQSESALVRLATFQALEEAEGADLLLFPRSEERRVGKECFLLCRSRWSPYH